MKLLRRIAIAMLAMSAMAGTFALTGCGDGNVMDDAADMVSEVVSDVTSGFSDLMSDVLPEPSSAAFDENSAVVSESQSSQFERIVSTAGDYRKGYYAGYESLPFVELFEQNVSYVLSAETTAENLTVEWQEGWTGNGDHAPDESDSLLQDGEIPFTGCVMYDDPSGNEISYYLYMSYDPNENTVSAVRVYDGREDADSVKDAEEAQIAVEKFLTMEPQTF